MVGEWGSRLVLTFIYLNEPRLNQLFDLDNFLSFNQIKSLDFIFPPYFDSSPLVYVDVHRLIYHSWGCTLVLDPSIQIFNSSLNLMVMNIW